MINPLSGAILALGAMAPGSGQNEIVIRQTMRVTMSCDHRAIDGAVGAKFCKRSSRSWRTLCYCSSAEPDAKFMIDHGSGRYPIFFIFMPNESPRMAPHRILR